MGGIAFHWYGLIVGFAATLWWITAERLESGLKKSIPVVLVLALVGARAYHVLEYWEYYQNNLNQIMRVWEGGLSIWGALIGGGGYIWYTARNMIWAVITPLPLAQAVGRVANGVNGEFTNKILGVPWWGMEALLDLGLFGIIWVIPKKVRVGAYILGYGLIRLVLSPYR